MARRGEKKIDTWDFMVDGRDQANAKKKELVLIAREGWRLPDDGE